MVCERRTMLGRGGRLGERRTGYEMRTLREKGEDDVTETGLNEKDEDDERERRWCEREKISVRGREWCVCVYERDEDGM